MWKCAKKPACSGFTLIELSIVLVIIGLVIGGVLVGRDLITAAQVRATIAQIEKYKTAVNTFKLKYNGLPGDLVNATSVGFTTFGNLNGNGDKCISDCAWPWDEGLLTDLSPSNSYPYAYEAPLFWQELGQSSLIDGSYDGDYTVAADSVGRTFPRLVLNATVGLLAYSHYGVGYMTMINTTAAWTGTWPAIKPIEAQQIDQKMDDGFPGSGTIDAVDGGLDGFVYEVYNNSDLSTAPPLPLTPGFCAYVASGDNKWVYNVIDLSASCALRFRAGF